MGLGDPMTWWDPELCAMLARRGFYVIRFDNRDVGRSSAGTGRVTRRMLVRAFAGRRVRAPYSMHDLADDAFGLLDHLGIESAHVVGVSMGGMIAQTMAIEQPDAGAVADEHHVDHRQAHRRLAAPAADAGPAASDQARPRGVRREQRADLADDRLTGLPPSRGADPRAAPARRSTAGVSASGALRQMMAVLTQPNRSPSAPRACTCRPWSCTASPTRWCTSPAAGRPPPRSPAPSCCSSTGWATTCRPRLYETLVDAITRTAARA